MKKHVFIILLWLFSAPTFAQFKLSGKITNYAGGADLKINLPVVYGLFDQNSINIPVSKSGGFTVAVPVKNQRLATFIFKGNHYILLLTDKKDLVVELNTLDKNIKITGGSASAENNVLNQVKINEPGFFLLTDVYNNLDYAGLTNRVVKPYLAARDKKIATVNKSTINAADKKLIAAEIKYAAYNNLFELTDNAAENPTILNKLVADIFAKAAIQPDVMPAGPQYYMFVNYYLIEAEKKASARTNTLLGRWQSATKYLPTAVAEQFGYQLIVRAFYTDNAAQGKQVAAAYLKKFPAGIYAADVKKKASK